MRSSSPGPGKRGYVILTADLDFGHLLSLTGEAGPSVILLRLPSTEPPEASAPCWRSSAVPEDLGERGALAVIGPEKDRGFAFCQLQ
jgi:predicted nuclease of predicted toxin-antitoxin system